MTAGDPSHQGAFLHSVYDPEDQDRRSRKRRGRWVLGGTAVVVLIALILAGAYLLVLQRSYSSNVTHFPQADSDGSAAGEDPTNPLGEDRPEATDATNILLLGSDSNGGSGADEDLPRVPGGGRSDTMMFIHIPAGQDSVQVVSIPRDLWVEIPGGYGWHKVNAGLSLGGDQGPWLTRATVEQLFDVRIDHITAVDLLGFVGLVEALGGVTVDSSYPESFTTNDGYTFNPGSQEMNADEALSFVRHRSSFPDGDLQRIRNQQALIRAVVDEAASPATLANPLRVNDMVSTFSDHLITDEELSASRAASLAWDARGAADNMTFSTLPTGGNGYSDDGQWIFYQDEQAMEEISQALDEDRLDEYLSD